MALARACRLSHRVHMLDKVDKARLRKDTGPPHALAP